MAAVLLLKFCETIGMREWGLLDMDYVVGRLSSKYCIAFESIIGSMLEEMTVDSKVDQTDYGARRRLLHSSTDVYQQTNRCAE